MFGDQRKLFDFTAGDPSNWLAACDNLRVAEALMLQDIRRAFSTQDVDGNTKAREIVSGRIFVYLMLAGMALENALKGICIKRKVVLVADGELSNWQCFGHNLLALADRAGFSLEKGERPILGHMTECILWAGRYPVPRSSERESVYIPAVWEVEEVDRWLETTPAMIERLLSRASLVLST